MSIGTTFAAKAVNPDGSEVLLCIEWNGRVKLGYRVVRIERGNSRPGRLTNQLTAERLFHNYIKPMAVIHYWK